MYITARSDYAIRALAELATLPPTERKSAATIGAGARIPPKFLEAILSDLLHAGLVISRRGAGGGYALAHLPEHISVAEIVRVIDGPLAAVGGRAPEETSYAGAGTALTQVWIALRAAMRDVLESTSLADIASGTFSSQVTRWLSADGAWERRSQP